MVKEIKYLVKIICILLLVSFIVFPTYIYAADDGWLSGKIGEIDSSEDIGGIASETSKVMGSAQNVVSKVGEGLAIVILIVIGIKYMTSAPEGRAEYKKYLIPYVIGAMLVFGASWIVGQLASSGGDVSLIGDRAVSETQYVMSIVQTVVRVIGIAVATITLIVLGIKYMTSSPEGKAEFSKTAIPYLVGAIIVFGASQIVGIIAGAWTGNGFNGDNYVAGAQTVMGTIISVLRVIGVGVAIIMLIVLAIKYMKSSPEGKAEFSKTAVPYIVGALILFAATGIVDIIYQFSTNIGVYNDEGEIITVTPDYNEEKIDQTQRIESDTAIKKKQIKYYQDQIKDLKNDVSDLENEKSDFESEKDILEKEKADIEKEKRQLENEKARLENESNNEDEIIDIQEQINSKNTDIYNVNKKISTKTNNIARKQKQIDSKNKQIEDYEKQIKKLQTEIKELENNNG